MGCHTLPGYFVVSHSIVAFLLVFLIEILKGISGKGILGNSVMLCTSLEVIPLNYIF